VHRLRRGQSSASHEKGGVTGCDEYGRRRRRMRRRRRRRRRRRTRLG